MDIQQYMTWHWKSAFGVKIVARAKESEITQGDTTLLHAMAILRTHEMRNRRKGRFGMTTLYNVARIPHGHALESDTECQLLINPETFHKPAPSVLPQYTLQENQYSHVPGN
jgi:hypothetical protein